MFGIHVALLFVIEHTPFLRMFQKLKDAIQLPSFWKEGCPKGRVVGFHERLSINALCVHLPPPPIGYSSFQKEEKLCRKLIYNSKNYKVTTKKATARLLLSVSQTDSPTAAQNRVPAAEGQNQHYRDSSSTPA